MSLHEFSRTINVIVSTLRSRNTDDAKKLANKLIYGLNNTPSAMMNEFTNNIAPYASRLHDDTLSASDIINILNVPEYNTLICDLYDDHTCHHIIRDALLKIL